MPILSHKIELDPTIKQQIYFARACGVARFAYNWALTEWRDQYQMGGRPSEVELRRLFNYLKHEKYHWATEVTKCAVQQAIMNLGDAFNRFFKKHSKYPRFKKKGICDSFRTDDGRGLLFTSSHVQLPIIGVVHIKEPLRFQGRIIEAIISRVAHKWFLSVTVATQVMPAVAQNQSTVGVDLGIKSTATCSDGYVYVGPHAYHGSLKRLRRLQRTVSRRRKGSSNRRKAARRVAVQHYRVACIRQDFIHKMTTELVRKYQTIVIEDLNVRGMVKNRHLAMSLLDRSFGEIRRQLTYKCALHVRHLVVADRFFPSSKTCSCCGYKLEELPLYVRQWTCPSCGAQHDRDLNAARNLAQYIRGVPPEFTPVETGSSCTQKRRTGAGRRSRNNNVMSLALHS